MTLEEQKTKKTTKNKQIPKSSGAGQGAQQPRINTSYTNSPQSARLTTGNTSLQHSDLPCPSQKHIPGTRRPGHCSGQILEHHTSEEFNKKASCTSSEEPALGKAEKSAIFQATLALETEPRWVRHLLPGIQTKYPREAEKSFPEHRTP